jgi:hypothetical protein
MEATAMRGTLTVMTLIFFVSTILSCAINEKKLKKTGADLLSQQELVEIFSQNRVVNLSSGSGSVEGHYFTDGTQKIVWPGGLDMGKYEIRNGQFCSEWTITRAGKEECYRIYNTQGDEYIWVKLDGSFDSKMIIIK